MESTESTTKLSSVLASLSETLANFRCKSAEIESKFIELVDGLAELGPLTVGARVIAQEPSALDSVAVEQLKKLDRSIAEQREEFAGKQDQLSDDVGRLREIVDEQVKLFAQQQPAKDSIAVEQLENLDRSIAEQREEFAGKQTQLSDDVARLREIVDQQMKLFSQEQPTKDSIAVEQLENLDRSIAEQREEFAGKQTQLSDDVARLREIVDEQVTLFAQQQPAKDSIAVEQLVNLDRSMAEQREEFAGKQDQLSDDVGRLREVVDQQVQLFAAWIKATSTLQKGNSSPKRSQKNSVEDEVLGDVFSQFDELRGASTAVVKVPTT